MINERTATGRIGHLLATYAYDRWLGTDTNESYAKQLDAIATQYGKGETELVDSVRSRASRASQLTKPLAEYAGRYTSYMLGNTDVKPKTDGGADGILLTFIQRYEYRLARKCFEELRFQTSL